MSTPTEKACLRCGVTQPLDKYQFRKAEQTYRNTCKACRAAEHRARRRHPDNVEPLREQERQRNARRRPAIKQWQRDHPERMRPGQLRRAARRAARLQAQPRPPRPPRYTDRPLLGPFRAVLPPARRGRPPKGGVGG